MFTAFQSSGKQHTVNPLPWLLIEPTRRLFDIGGTRAYPTAHSVTARYATRDEAETAMVAATMDEEKAYRLGQTKRHPRQRYIAKDVLHVDCNYNAELPAASNWSRKVAMLFNTID
jgi:hypothetical protein